MAELRRQALSRLFTATDYRVAVDGLALSLRVGQACPLLEARLPPGTGWGWLTAVNPGARRLPEAENAARIEALRARLIDTGIAHWPAEAVADDGGWPVEPGFVVCALRLDDARAIAADFGQAAILWGESGTPARLEWLACP